MTDHTPGPWEVWTGSKREETAIFHSGRTVAKPIKEGAIAVAYCDYHTPEIAEANARLIAAAPDLLSICEIFLGGDERFQVAVGGNPTAVDKMLAAARATVAAAKGGPSGESSP